MAAHHIVVLLAFVFAIGLAALALLSKDPGDQRYFARCFFLELGGLFVVWTVGQPLAALAALIASA
jgi:hypothetical protein